jgi:tetratricopeptide (TPR) repeat protein
VVWDCPRCEQRNTYDRVQVMTTNYRYAIRMTCRGCLMRWDIESHAGPRFQERPEKLRLDREDFARAMAMKATGRRWKAYVMCHQILSRAPWYAPARLEIADYHRSRGELLQAMDHAALAVRQNPFEPELHLFYADLLMEERAVAAARLFYAQALLLDPANDLATKALARIDGPEFTDTDRETFFVSHSDEPAPTRRKKDVSEPLAIVGIPRFEDEHHATIAMQLVD